MHTQSFRLCTRWPSRSAVAFWAFVAVVGPCARFAVAAPSPAPSPWRTDSLHPTDTWNTLTLQMKVRRKRVSIAGEQTAPAAPAATYRIERSSRSGRWKTIITVVGVERQPMYSLAGTLIPRGAFPVSRIEDDEDGSPVRVYDASGRRLSTTSEPLAAEAAAASTLPRSSGRTWLEAFVASAALKNQRMQDFERQWGTGAKAGALMRFLRNELDASHEVLVDPGTAVPVESSGRRAGRLTARRTFTYGPAPDGSVVRASVHSETLASPDTGERVIVHTAFSNVRLELRR